MKLSERVRARRDVYEAFVCGEIDYATAVEKLVETELPTDQAEHILVCARNEKIINNTVVQTEEEALSLCLKAMRHYKKYGTDAVLDTAYAKSLEFLAKKTAVDEKE